MESSLRSQIRIILSTETKNTIKPCNLSNKRLVMMYIAKVTVRHDVIGQKRMKVSRKRKTREIRRFKLKYHIFLS